MRVHRGMLLDSGRQLLLFISGRKPGQIIRHKVDCVINELENLAEEISKQSALGVAWFLLAGYSAM